MPRVIERSDTLIVHSYRTLFKVAARTIDLTSLLSTIYF